MNLKKRTESQLNLLNIVTRIQKLTVLVTEIYKLPQFEPIINIAEDDLLANIKGCYLDTIDESHTLY